MSLVDSRASRSRVYTILELDVWTMHPSVRTLWRNNWQDVKQEFKTCFCRRVYQKQAVLNSRMRTDEKSVALASSVLWECAQIHNEEHIKTITRPHESEWPTITRKVNIIVSSQVLTHMMMVCMWETTGDRTSKTLGNWDCGSSSDIRLEMLSYEFNIVPLSFSSGELKYCEARIVWKIHNIVCQIWKLRNKITASKDGRHIIGSVRYNKLFTTSGQPRKRVTLQFNCTITDWRPLRQSSIKARNSPTSTKPHEYKTR